MLMFHLLAVTSDAGGATKGSALMFRTLCIFGLYSAGIKDLQTSFFVGPPTSGILVVSIS